MTKPSFKFLTQT